LRSGSCSRLPPAIDDGGPSPSSGVLWAAGYVASGLIGSLALFFMPYVAVLDIALVLFVLKRDIRFG
jgi:hypothetical protein